MSTTCCGHRSSLSSKNTLGTPHSALKSAGAPLLQQENPASPRQADRCQMRGVVRAGFAQLHTWVFFRLMSFPRQSHHTTIGPRPGHPPQASLSWNFSLFPEAPSFLAHSATRSSLESALPTFNSNTLHSFSKVLSRHSHHLIYKLPKVCLTEQQAEVAPWSYKFGKPYMSYSPLGASQHMKL